MLRDQRGITGLETAIVLIAFVVVASVFAFAVLSSGLLASEKAKTTVTGSVAEGGVALQIKGSIIAHSSSTGTTTGSLIVGRLQIPVISATDQPIDLSAASMVVTYIDANQVVDLTRDANADTADGGGANAGWVEAFRAGDTGPMLDTGERADIWLNLQGLTTLLAASTQFTVQIKPDIGAILEIQRTTPGEITLITNLK